MPAMAANIPAGPPAPEICCNDVASEGVMKFVPLVIPLNTGTGHAQRTN